MTEPATAETPLPPGDESFRTLFDFLPIGAYRSTPDGRQLRANPALVRMNGYASEDELLAAVRDIGREWYVDPARRVLFGELMERDGQVSAFVSEVYRHRSRERMWVSENAHAVRGADGRVAFYEGTVEEITERVRSESALQRNERHLRQIAEHIPGMVYRVHFAPDQPMPLRYTFVSHGVTALYGLTPGQVLADPMCMRAFRHPDDVQRVDREVRDALDRGLPLTVDYRIVVDGQVKHVQMSSSAAISAHGEQVRVGVMLDVTAQRQAGALRDERDRAEAARRQMTQFLSRVSHELRTPLNAILGFAQLIEMEPDTPGPQRRWTQGLLDSGRHLLELVNDVLDLSGAQSGQMAFDLTAVDLLPVLRESWSMLSAEAARRGLVFGGLPTLEALPTVRADRRRLLQVCSNLLSNAVKFNRQGGRIELHLRADVAAVEFDVVDTGKGIAPDLLSRLFNPFDRLGVQHGSVPGTGLGLSLSRQLLQAMGGSIRVRSTPGEGSNFTVRLARGDLT